MSKITINLNSIINTYCENRFDTLENRIESACSSLFDFPYIEDEDARKTFEMLFCTTYIDRDIYTTSVALWRLQLKSRLQSYAPIFNQKMGVIKTEFQDIKSVSKTTGSASNTSSSEGSGVNNQKDINSRFPENMLNAQTINSVERAEYGSRSEGVTSQSSINQTDGETESQTETTPNQLELYAEYNKNITDLCKNLVDDLHDLFLIYL